MQAPLAFVVFLALLPPLATVGYLRARARRRAAADQALKAALSPAKGSEVLPSQD